MLREYPNVTHIRSLNQAHSALRTFRFGGGYKGAFVLKPTLPLGSFVRARRCPAEGIGGLQKRVPYISVMGIAVQDRNRTQFDNSSGNSTIYEAL